MTRITGTEVITTTLGESVRAFVPRTLPPTEPPLASGSFADLNRQAELALARLAGVSGLVPSVDWLLYSAIRKEALLTSQIEGTQATLTDLFDDEAGLKLSNTDDVEEVTNYLRAFRWVRGQLRDPQGLPISVRLLCEAHRLLLGGARGAGKQPGELRRSQNWIGGTRPGNAAFVPPPPQHVGDLLSDLERFIHAVAPELPPLVRIALIHAQFETIHPFLEGVVEASGDAERSIIDLASLITADRKRLLESPKAGPVSYRLFELLPMMPPFRVEHVRQRLETTFPTASAAVKLLEGLGMLTELTGQKKNRVYSYRAYVALLSR